MSFSYFKGFRIEGNHDGNELWRQVAMPDPNIKQQPSLFRTYFYNQKHKTLMSYYSPLGPVLISYKSVRSDYYVLVYTEKGIELIVQPKGSFYRGFFRIFFNIRPTTHHFIEGVRPELADCTMVKVTSAEVQDELLKIHEPEFPNVMKIGLLYCKDGQTDEVEMLRNIQNTASPEYLEFLEFLGDLVELKGFEQYSGGLDTVNNYSGTHSIFNKYNDVEVMFHVSTLLPFIPTDHRQVERKKHIGNDRILIIFNDGRQPYSPNTMKSKQTQIVILIHPIRGEIAQSTIAISTPLSPSIDSTNGNNSNSNNINNNSGPEIPLGFNGKLNNSSNTTRYMVSIASKVDVPSFGEALPNPPIFNKDDNFKRFLYDKLIAATNSVRNSPVFNHKTQREKNILFLNIINKYTRDPPPQLSV